MGHGVYADDFQAPFDQPYIQQPAVYEHLGQSPLLPGPGLLLMTPSDDYSNLIPKNLLLQTSSPYPDVFGKTNDMAGASLQMIGNQPVVLAPEKPKRSKRSTRARNDSFNFEDFGRS